MALREQAGLAAAKYREALLATATEVPVELVAGDTVEEIDRSLAAARKMVEAVQRQLADRAAAERVPAGPPEADRAAAERVPAGPPEADRAAAERVPAGLERRSHWR